MESCPTQAVLPLVGLAAEKVIRDRYITYADAGRGLLRCLDGFPLATGAATQLVRTVFEWLRASAVPDAWTTAKRSFAEFRERRARPWRAEVFSGGKRIAGKGMYGTRIQAVMPEAMRVRLPLRRPRRPTPACA
ncbi:MAG: hypothetical protein ACQESR_06415 [Planctomycetota bacterium]